MTRNLKALGLALVAALAMSAFAASSASAVDVFTSEGTENITAVGDDNVFELTGSEVAVECTTAHFEGEVENGAEAITVKPEYEGTIDVVPHTHHCGSSTGEATVDMNGCGYILTGETTGEDPVNEKDATVWIECPDEKEITVTTSLGVNLHIHEQTPTEGGVIYTNVGDNVEIEATATGITYSCTPHFLCTLGGIPTEGNDADYTGTVLAEGSGKIEVSS